MEATTPTSSGSSSKPTEDRQETAYVILQQGDNGGFWPVETPGSDDGNVRAGSQKRAIELHLNAVDVDDDNDPTGRVYVAIPARSWRPIPVGGVEEVPAKRQFKLG